MEIALGVDFGLDINLTELKASVEKHTNIHQVELRAMHILSVHRHKINSQRR